MNGEDEVTGGVPQSMIDEVAERLVAEVIDEARQEVKALVKDRLLRAALARLEQGEVFDAAPTSRSMASEIDGTVRIIGEAAETEAPAPGHEDRRFAPEDLGYYVYGITRAGQGAPAEPGIDPSWPVEAVSMKGIQALASRVPLRDFGDAALERNLQDLAWLGARATAHERVLARALESGPVLPLRFGTIFRDEDRLRAQLRSHGELFLAGLDRLEGKAEWEVKTVCRPQEFSRRVEERSDRVAAVRAEGRGGEGAAFMHRKRFERVLAEEIERVRDEIGREVTAAVAAYAEDAVPTGSVGSAPEGWEVLRSDAFLVPEPQWSAFWRAVDETGTRFAEWGVELQVAGPLPPYRFAAVDLRERADA